MDHAVQLSGCDRLSRLFALLFLRASDPPQGSKPPTTIFPLQFGS